MDGVIRLNGFPAFVGTRGSRTVDDLVDHAMYIVNLLGIDYYHGRPPPDVGRVAYPLSTRP
jgi:hypothetical protein